MRARWTIAICAGAAAIAVAPATVAAVGRGGGEGPLPAEVTAQGDTVKSEIGSYCVDTEPGEDGSGSGVCADKIFSRPGPAHTLSVAPRTSLRIVFGDDPGLQDTVESASGALYRFDRRDRPHPAGRVEIQRAGDEWSLTLPKKMRRADTLMIFTRLEGDGDIAHLIGLDNSRRQPLQCPGKTGEPVEAAPLRGLEVAAAEAEASRRGCALRVVRADGKALPVTDDFSLSRVNVIVRAGVVVGVDGFY
jgi:hypothetical protein